MSISQNFPAISPTLNLNFARSKKLDPRITFTRTSSATRTNAQGMIEVVSANTPRFDHSYNSSTGSVNSLGLLVEEARTNLTTYSDYSSGNSLNNVTSTTNATTAPDGTNTAISMTGSVGTSVKYLYKLYSTTTTGTYTTSVFAKYNGEQYILLRVNDNTGVNDGQQRFDILNGIKDGNVANNGTATGASSTITSYPNGWYRLSVTVTFNSALTSLQGAGVYLTGYTTTSSTNSVYIWGAQLEAGAFPTSYIPTVASTVTRSADNASITGTNFSSWYNPSEGTLFAQFKSELSINNNIWSINNYPATTFAIITNYFRLLTLSNVIHTQYNVGGTNLYPQFSLANNNSQKVTQSYNINSSPIISALNGTIGTGSGNIYATSPGFNQLEFGKNTDQRTTIGQYTISQLSYYPKRLTNSQLQNLTK